MKIEPMPRPGGDQELVRALARELSALPPQPLTIMEVCGTHTMSIARYGLRGLLPPSIRLVSGPGCPVCVTDSSLISAALAIAAQPGVIFTSFGDMLRVPAGENSLLAVRDQGADVRLVLSPLDALALAEQNGDKEIVFFAVGFETTAPLTAATLRLAAERKIENFSVIPAHKTMPAALRSLLAASKRIDALLCPGHVAAITGARAFSFVPRELGKPAAVAGFGAAEIMRAVLALARLSSRGEIKLLNCYPHAVRAQGNATALAMLDEVFAPTDATWRGLGVIQESGLGLRDGYARFDALSRFAEAVAAAPRAQDNPACCCGSVLRGEAAPGDCPLFARACTPGRPAGACMVSSEGACAAAYRYCTAERS